jgi:hypothetical protein
MVQAATGKVTEVLAGLVDRVTFHNAENGFCVLRVKARGQRDLITVLGHAAMISAGEFVQASGSWVNDRTHGVQLCFQFSTSCARNPRRPMALRRRRFFASYTTTAQPCCAMRPTITTSRTTAVFAPS